MKKFLFKKQFFPRPEENLMKNVENVQLAREKYLNNQPSNLKFLLNKRYNWMNEYIKKNDSGIEVGCGSGLSKEFIKKKYELTDFTDYHWVDKKVNALEMPYKDNSHDFIISCNMIHHLAKPCLFFSECRRVLKPKGKLIIQEVNSSFFMRLLLNILNHEGYSYEVNPFDINEVCNDPKDLWSGNNALPEILFRDSKKFEKEFRFKIVNNEFTEFMIFPLSGGVVSNIWTINLPWTILKIIDMADSLLCKLFPSIFALQRRIVLVNDSK